MFDDPGGVVLVEPADGTAADIASSLANGNWSFQRVTLGGEAWGATNSEIFVIDARNEIDRFEAVTKRAGWTLAIVADEAGAIAALDAGADDALRVTDGVPEQLLHRRVKELIDRCRRENDRDRYRTLVETVDDPMYLADASGKVRLVNTAFVEQLGLDRETVIGGPVTRWIDAEDDTERESAILLDLVDDGNRNGRGRFEFEHETDDGDRRQFEDHVAVLTDDNDEYLGSVGVIRDITERQARERELERYRTIVETAGDAMYALDEDGFIVMVNDSHAEFAGTSREVLVGSHALEHMRPEHVKQGRKIIEELLEHPDRNRGRFEFEIEVDGERGAYEDVLAVVRDDEGEFRGSVGVIRDITDRKRRKEALEVRNKRLDEFASVVSHDLRNPVDVIDGHLDLARETGDPQYFDAIQESVDRIRTLLSELLTLAREGRVIDEIETVAVTPVVDAAWESVDTGQASLTRDEDLGLIEADETRLRELFENLFRNAVEHGDVAGTVQVKALTGVAGDGAEAVRDVGGIAVTDDGPGIPSEEREAVFDHGYTTREGGTGFGLSIVDQIVEAHGWTIDATESKTGGARFEIRW